MILWRHRVDAITVGKAGNNMTIILGALLGVFALVLATVPVLVGMNLHRQDEPWKNDCSTAQSDALRAGVAATNSITHPQTSIARHTKSSHDRESISV